MPPIIVRVYVSSTWIDLQPERLAVEQALQQMRETKFVGMEHFGTHGEPARQGSLVELDRADVYVGIFGERYGSGITEAEYRRARERSLPCFIYHKKLDPDRGHDPDLIALKTEHLDHHLIRPPFVSPEHLAYYVTSDLHRWLFDEYLTPRLEPSARGQAPREEVQALLNAINADLLAQLRRASSIVVSAERSIAIGGSASHCTIITGDHNQAP